MLHFSEIYNYLELNHCSANVVSDDAYFLGQTK